MNTIRLCRIITPFYLLSLFVCFSSLQAQHREGPGSREDLDRMIQGRQEKRQEKEYFEKLCDYLHLEKKQRKAAEKLFKKMQKETEKIAEKSLKGKIAPYEASEKRIKMQKDFREKFKDILNEDQQKKYEKLRETGLKNQE